MSEMSKGNFVNGKWTEGNGGWLKSESPANDEVVWAGKTSSIDDVDQAFRSARSAFAAWCHVPLDERVAAARRFQEIVKLRAEAFAKTISREMGKPLWEAKTEVAAVAGKVDLAIDALQTRRSTVTSELNGMRAVTRFKPHGVLGVLGPFNLPAHLPNGHIVPALLAGNTVVFKPSEMTPLIAETMVGFWDEADLPAGVVNLVQGSRQAGMAITQHDELDGLLFTGSSRAGVAINQALATHPQKMVALEMGGNNPLIVHEVEDLQAAAHETVLSAFITSGQRCTCARRLILVNGSEADHFLDALVQFLSRIRIGYYDDGNEPFYGPVISKDAGRQVLAAQQELRRECGFPIVLAERQRDNDALLSPGIIEITGCTEVEDEEIFGPLLQVIRVESFDEAIAAANRTRYGLSAGLLSDNQQHYQDFISRIRAGVVNWNRQTTGASGKLPFGGCGLSGNHRPSGYYAADYCSFPVASLETENLAMPDKLLPGLD